jgi:hypothetical protein
MRVAAALVDGVMLLGLVSTVVVADGSIFDSSFKSQQKIVSVISIKGVGKTTLKMESPSAYGHVGYPGEPGYPGSSYLSGVYTTTVSGSGGNGSDLITNTVSMAFPFSSFDSRESKVSLKADNELWMNFGSDLEYFLNRSHGVFTTTEPVEWKKAPVELGGPIEITSVKSGGKLKADKKTFSKFKGNLTIKYTGTIVSGPNAGKPVKGKLRVKFKKGEPVVF